MPGDRVLVRKVVIQGKHKLADLWGTEPCIVRSKTIPDMPVFRAERENSVLHRNLFLPFYVPPSPFSEPPAPRRTTKHAPEDLVVN